MSELCLRACEHQALLNADVHLDLLDLFAALQGARLAVEEAYAGWVSLRRDLAAGAYA